MLINIILFLVGLVLLIKGSDFFVEASASIAKKLGVSELVIGLTLVALGTSIPELASSVIASLKQHSGLIIGNVIGSNIANIGLIVGIAATITAIKTKEHMLKRDGYIMIFVTVVFYIFMLNNSISRIEAGVFLLFYFAYIVFLFEVEAKDEDESHFREFIRYFFRFKYLLTVHSRILAGIRYQKKNDHKLKKEKVSPVEKKEVKELFKAGIYKDYLTIVISGIAIVFGAKYLVEGAIYFASAFNVSDTLIGVSIVALGTSLPELSVSISAARKGYGNIVVGNIIGSNIANILLVTGVSALILPLKVISSTIVFTGPFMILMSILLLVFIKSYWQIKRIEGTIFLILYTVFIMLLFFNGFM